jgi:hypothetical protein
MKKLILVSVYVCLTAVAIAQSPLTHNSNNNRNHTYSRFKIDGTIGGAFPTGNQPNGMLVLNAEPHYRISDANAVGFRVQEAFLRQLNNSVLDGFTVSPMDSYSATIEHYFSNNFFRPFVSFGAGIFRQGKVVNSVFASNSINEQIHPGIFPRIGFEIGLLRVATEYNIMGSNSNGTNPGYITFTAGFFLGGGGNDRR